MIGCITVFVMRMFIYLRAESLVQIKYFDHPQDFTKVSRNKYSPKLRNRNQDRRDELTWK